MKSRLCHFVALLAAALGACVQLPPAPQATAIEKSRDCRAWFAALDQAILDAGVGDGQEARIPGHPHLRSNRFTAALAGTVTVSDARVTDSVLPMLRALDRTARAAELRNLPPAAYAVLGQTRQTAQERTEQCATELSRALPLIRSVVHVSEDYSEAQRVFGLYAFSRYPFIWGVEGELRRTRLAFAAPLSSLPLTRYEAAGPASDSSGAPVFEKEMASAADASGALVWNAAGSALTLDTTAPTIYVQHSLTRYHGQILRQVSYQIWWNARPATGPGDLLAGHLDGLIWRVTMDDRGRPLVYDSIHPCGCYHYFFTTRRARPLPAPPGEPEWAFVAQELPDLASGERFVLRIAAGTQQLVRVRVATAPVPNAVSAVLTPLDQLRSLPHPTGGYASAYGPDGLVAGTERAERFLFWPMGIASAGQMRQWGRHATAFVGTRHFDDADLFEKRFLFSLEP